MQESVIMATPTRYSRFLNEREPTKTKKSYLAVGVVIAAH